MGIQIDWRDADGRLSLRLAAGSRMRPPLRRRIEARVVGTKRAGSLVRLGVLFPDDAIFFPGDPGLS